MKAYRQGTRKGWVSLKTENQRKILTILARSPLSFTELLEETSLSAMGLTRHLGELEELGYVRKTRINGKRVYEIQKIPSVEELVIESLVDHLEGRLTAICLLKARVKGEKGVYMEEFYDV